MREHIIRLLTALGYAERVDVELLVDDLLHNFDIRFKEGS
jgi:hypothetical protein